MVDLSIVQERPAEPLLELLPEPALARALELCGARGILTAERSSKALRRFVRGRGPAVDLTEIGRPLALAEASPLVDRYRLRGVAFAPCAEIKVSGTVRLGCRVSFRRILPWSFCA